MYRLTGELYNNCVFATVDLTPLPKNEFVMTYVGGGQIYLVIRGKLQQLTNGHIEAQRLCDLNFDNPHIDLRTDKIQSEDIALLLTDGAHKIINNEQLHQIVFECGNCFETCNGVIKVANTLGGPDNILVCVSYFRK